MVTSPFQSKAAENYPFKVGDTVVITKGEHIGFEYRITHISYGMFFCGQDVPGTGWNGDFLEFAEIHHSPLMKALT
jgi:hypothetical protein